VPGDYWGRLYSGFDLLGGSAGMLICGFVADELGILSTVVITELTTGGLMLSLIAGELGVAMVTLPILGIAPTFL
jgi:hypothetical protein